MSTNTGYNRAYLHEIKASLVKSGYLRLVHRTNDLGGQDTNAYDFSGLLDAIRVQLDATKENKQASLTGLTSEPGLTPPEPEAIIRDIEPAARRRSRLAAQARASKIASLKAVEDQSNPGIIDQTRVGISEHTHPSGNVHIRVGINGHTLPDINQHTPPGINRQTNPPITRQRAVSINKQTDPVLSAKPAYLSPGTQREVSQRQHESETIQKEALKRDDSNQRSRLEDSGERSSIIGNGEEHILYSPYIAAVVSDFSNELGDANHVFSNVTQALRIYTRSGLGEEEFSAILFEARKVVRTYQGKQGVAGIQNKMAYFFVALRGLAPAQSE
jgi:hypothetical protein